MEGERDAALAGVEQRTHLSEELERAVHPAATLPCNNIQPLRNPAAPLRTHAHARTRAHAQEFRCSRTRETVRQQHAIARVRLTHSLSTGVLTGQVRDMSAAAKWYAKAAAQG
jgi:TPR repeat protein